jgi:hypothetical protein
MEQLESSYSEILSLLKDKPQTGLNVPILSPTTAPWGNGTQSSGAANPVSLTGLGVDNSTAIGINMPDGISMAEMECLVNDYRRMACRNFPYVIISENCSTASLIDEHPMLAQAVLVTTTWRAPLRQSKFKKTFLADVSERYFVRTERSLDLLQALIVYTAW